MSPTMTVAAALLLVAAAYPYVRRAKHPETRMLVAYLLFIGVFALVAAALFLAVSGILVAVGIADRLERPLGAALFLLVICLPAFLLARRQVRRAPHAREATP